MLAVIRFDSPWWLLALVPVGVLAWWKGRSGQPAALVFSSISVLGSAAQSTKIKPGRGIALLRAAALGLVVVSLARPQAEKSETREDSRGINLMLTLDFSGSMRSLDFYLDGRRTTRSKGLKKLSAEFIRSRASDRVGIVSFDRDACLVCPLTLDHEWLLSRLEAETNGMGTAIGPALVVAAEHLQRHTNETRVIILMTDAENITGWPEPDTVAEALRPLGIRLHCVQILSPEQATPSNDLSELLTHAAVRTGGSFFRVRSGPDLRAVYAAIDKLEKQKLSDRKQKAWRELFPWFVFPGLALLLVEQLMAHTRWRRLP
jgi:Ca-activated chloride channel family protein